MAKKSLFDLLESEMSEEINTVDLSGLVSVLFKSRTESHITHLLQRRKLLCEHQALSQYYEEVTDLIDSFCETAMAHKLITNISVPAAVEIGDTLLYFRDLYEKMEAYRPKLVPYPFLESCLDDIQTLISQTIYRLEYIQN